MGLTTASFERPQVLMVCARDERVVSAGVPAFLLRWGVRPAPILRFLAPAHATFLATNALFGAPLYTAPPFNPHNLMFPGSV